MDLIKLDLQELEFRGTLWDVEHSAVTTSSRRRMNALCSTTGLVAGFGGMIVTMPPLMVLTFWAMGVHVVLGILMVLVMFLSALGAGMYGFMRYLQPDDRKLMPSLLEPQAKDFFLANVDRRERLLENAEAFDHALRVFKRLPERVGDEVDAGVRENFAERRAGLKAEMDAYVRDFEAATVEDRARVAAIEARRGKPRNPRKRELKAFADKAHQLAAVERSLDGLEGTVEKGMTVDLSPYVAAQRLRSELEEERAALVARGLKPKRLPKPRIGRKLLPA